MNECDRSWQDSPCDGDLIERTSAGGFMTATCEHHLFELEEALADCQALLNAIEDNAVVYQQPTCDVCGMYEEDVVWCGNCGCCQDHCQDFYGCGEE